MIVIVMPMMLLVMVMAMMVLVTVMMVMSHGKQCHVSISQLGRLESERTGA